MRSGVGGHVGKRQEGAGPHLGVCGPVKLTLHAVDRERGVEIEARVVKEKVPAALLEIVCGGGVLRIKTDRVGRGDKTIYLRAAATGLATLHRGDVLGIKDPEAGRFVWLDKEAVGVAVPGTAAVEAGRGATESLRLGIGVGGGARAVSAGEL